MIVAEKQVLTRLQAKKIAEGFRDSAISAAKKKRLEKIPFTLLSASQIKIFVKDTGAISPFFEGGAPKSRLKKSAYEGRIGTKAYKFDSDSAPIQTFDSENDKTLLIPKNSIVFVECDLDFRLPDFIAARFNLQIRHVHRGLLLGTGPLVDPGFWGKLCIPIHNLTDEDYEIPAEEGLIWLEFTKTTGNIPKELNGVDPFNGRQFWDISEYLIKASKQFGLNGSKPMVPIRSSLPSMFADATTAATNAEKAATKVAAYNFYGAFGAIVAVGALMATFVFSAWDTRKVLNELQPRLFKIEQEFTNHGNAIATSIGTDNEAQSILTNLLQQVDVTNATTKEISEQLQEQIAENETLTATVQSLEDELGRLDAEIKFLQEPQGDSSEN